MNFQPIGSKDFQEDDTEAENIITTKKPKKNYGIIRKKIL